MASQHLTSQSRSDGHLVEFFYRAHEATRTPKYSNRSALVVLSGFRKSTCCSKWLNGPTDIFTSVFRSKSTGQLLRTLLLARVDTASGSKTPSKQQNPRGVCARDSIFSFSLSLSLSLFYAHCSLHRRVGNQAVIPFQSFLDT
jgi:hypothetical protein